MYTDRQTHTHTSWIGHTIWSKEMKGKARSKTKGKWNYSHPIYVVSSLLIEWNAAHERERKGQKYQVTIWPSHLHYKTWPFLSRSIVNVF